MDENNVICRRAGWMSAWVGDDLVMMHEESSSCLNLSGSGGRIWELLEQPGTIADLCQALSREYEIEPEAARSEVLAFLDQLRLHEAIDVRPPAMA